MGRRTADLRGRAPRIATSPRVSMSSGLSPARGSPRPVAGLLSEGVSLWEIERWSGCRAGDSWLPKRSRNPDESIKTISILGRLNVSDHGQFFDSHYG